MPKSKAYGDEKQKKVRALPMGSESPDHISTSVRKIDNGYLVSRTISDGKGYHSSEYHTPEKPMLHAAEPENGSAVQGGPGSLSKAVNYLKRC